MIPCALIPILGFGGVVDGPRLPVHGKAAKIVEGAMVQAREAASYTTGYFQITYPNGDLPRSKGVCTDVVIRALRHAGFDLQVLIHQDMARRFSTYPRRERRPDSNIDHRRCPNQAWFFRTYGTTLTNKVAPETLKHWKPGDIVYWKLDNGLDHTGVLTSRTNDRGEPYVVHNLGRCAEEDVLTSWKIVGHYRYPK
ncbi:MAG: DUF1287 domain-containing protein [Fimbriimonadaceae bacterium]|nr:DUF1287 domain-containing protein [Fimbriimonadaceae bacterium]